MDITPRPDCPTCGGTGEGPEIVDSMGNKGPCLPCYFGTHDVCPSHGLCKPCALCAVVAAALTDGSALPMTLALPSDTLPG